MWVRIPVRTSEDHQSLKRWRFSDAAIPKMPPRVRSPRKGNAIFGPVTQLGECYPCKVEVVSSNLIRSTILRWFNGKTLRLKSLSCGFESHTK